MNPMWGDRGGRNADLEGNVFWNSPAGFPWDVTPSSDPIPDFAKRANDPVYGFASTDVKRYDRLVHFRGYKNAAKELPTLNYTFDLGGGQTATFAETLNTLRSDLATGVLRDVVITAPSGNFVWLDVATCDSLPSWRSADGKTGQFAPGEEAVPASASVLTNQQGKPIVLHTRAAPPNAVWVISEKDGKRTLMLRCLSRPMRSKSGWPWKCGRRSMSSLSRRKNCWVRFRRRSNATGGLGPDKPSPPDRLVQSTGRFPR